MKLEVRTDYGVARGTCELCDNDANVVGVVFDGYDNDVAVATLYLCSDECVNKQRGRLRPALIAV